MVKTGKVSWQITSYIVNTPKIYKYPRTKKDIQNNPLPKSRKGDKKNKWDTLEIPNKYDKICTGKKVNLITKATPVINSLDNNGQSNIPAMQDLSMGIFEHLDITYWSCVDARLRYTESILKVAAHPKTDQGSNYEKSIYPNMLDTYGHLEIM